MLRLRPIKLRPVRPVSFAEAIRQVRETARAYEKWKAQTVAPAVLVFPGRETKKPYNGLWINDDGNYVLKTQFHNPGQAYIQDVSKVSFVTVVTSRAVFPELTVGALVSAVAPEILPEFEDSILKAREQEAKERTRAILRKQARQKEKVKSLHKPLQIIPQSLHPCEALAH